MKKVINYNLKHESMGVYRVRARLTTLQVENPTSLRKSAAAMLNSLKRRIKKHGFILNSRTYFNAKDRIEEMTDYCQYEDFVDDTNDIYEYLAQSIKIGESVAPSYLIAVNK